MNAKREQPGQRFRVQLGSGVDCDDAVLVKMRVQNYWGDSLNITTPATISSAAATRTKPIGS